jgi:Na+-translocating ferredoxin:NAD+ oxidoreductase RnfD subunit
MTPSAPLDAAAPRDFSAIEAPFLHAHESVRTLVSVKLLAAFAPLLAGVVLFGWRAAVVSAIAIFGCVAIEGICFRVTRMPGLQHREHALLTGVLLALTLPPQVPWFVPLIAAAFAIVVGKAVFGGQGHYVWQPALVGRFAVAVLFAALPAVDWTIAGSAEVDLGFWRFRTPEIGIAFEKVELDPPAWPILARNRLIYGDVRDSELIEPPYRWGRRSLDWEVDAWRYPPPGQVLSGLGDSSEPPFGAILYLPDPAEVPAAHPPALRKVPEVRSLLLGARPGGIGETSAIVIVAAGLYLVYRSHVKWQLPASILLAAAAAYALAPVYLAGPGQGVRTVHLPILAEGLDTGFIYVVCQLLGGQLFLVAFFLATEMTCRPVNTGAQVVFGAGVGVLSAVLSLYWRTPIPAYLAVLGMNTFSAGLDAAWRRRVLGQGRWHWLRRGRQNRRTEGRS